MYMLGYLFQKTTFEGLIRKKGRIEDIGVGVFHFVEMRSVFCLYLQNGLEFFN